MATSLRLMLLLGLGCAMCIYHTTNAAQIIPCTEPGPECPFITKDDPKLHYAMLGFNIFKASPITNGSGPEDGFTESLIFNPAVKTSSYKQYELRPWFYKSNYLTCTVSSSNRFFTTAMTYHELMRKKVLEDDNINILDVEIRNTLNNTVNETHLPTKHDFFLESDEYKKNKQFFIENRGTLVSNRYGMCHEFVVTLSNSGYYKDITLSTEMIEMLKEMNSATTMNSKERVFTKFIEKFGTHFMSKTYFGEKAGLVRRYSLKEVRIAKKSGLNKCNNERYRSISSNIPNYNNKTECSKISNSTIVDGYLRENVFLIGTTNPNPYKWSDDKIITHSPYRFELKPILNIFQKRYASLNGTIDYENILRWFAPMYVNYTKMMRNEANATVACGMSDTCDRVTERCINDRNEMKGFRCGCIPGCYINPCLNGGTCNETKTSLTCQYNCTCPTGFSGNTCETKDIDNKENYGAKLLPSLVSLIIPVILIGFFSAIN